MTRPTMIAVLLLTVLLAAVPLAAQEEVERTEARERAPIPLEERFEIWLRGQALLFENFFQATEGREEEDVSALQGELGLAVRLLRDMPVEAYASYNYIDYEEGLDTSDGFRVGLRGDPRPHAFNLYYDQQMDRPTFDVGDVFDRADVQTLQAEYAYRLTRHWQVGVEGTLQDQDYDLTPTRDNEFSSLGASVRYRGWRAFSPEVGYETGSREVEERTQDYDQDAWYLQVRSALSDDLYASFRVRVRDREYTTDDLASSNFGRADDRLQLSGYADYRLLEHLTLNLYGAWEDVDSNLEGRDFDTALWVAGLTLHF